MVYNVRISKEAQIELDVAECFFREKNLHEDFLEEFFKQVEFLKSIPKAFELKYSDIRILRFEQFNYSIHYVIEEDKVLILRILGQRQDF
ncbi:type II toxin-antitoxin system RelE/ParE family toxin [Pricia sp. S334]|uniref:Type II toxin-antitoxin system RelE/ParE family toxin n=1 Tax=Pricia mediterranea TaxID=3076079 RepID=A0ABU3L3S7_9FLAO|nr:type II toxin-antitoxin system RelE/ParE family toxin [Pricia sp. S334]MDT7828401.1 type II toxin-antitoxin system RelE/ParE family toxin [Pricia sp. S334]